MPLRELLRVYTLSEVLRAVPYTDRKPQQC